MFTMEIFRGAEALDAHFAKHGLGDWRSRIDTDILDLQTFATCILGQLFGDFNDGLIELGFQYEEAIECGFAGAFDRYDVLTNEWLDYLQR